MHNNTTTVLKKGKAVKVPSFQADNLTIIVTGKFTKLASIEDEVWLDQNTIGDLDIVIRNLRNSKGKANIFTFAQKLPYTSPNHSYYMEWDNFAVIPVVSFDDWWTKRLPQETRKNVRKAEKKGVVVKIADFNVEFIKGLVTIYNETPFRQGKAFWHYGIDFDAAKKGNSTYLSNSDFIGAYYNDELIGFIKLVYVGKVAQMMQILSMVKHQDKRPTNALIAKAVEICEKRNMEYLVYGKYVYDKKTESPLIEFKVRNGFEMVNIPRYYIPLTVAGEIILRLKLHHGIKGLLPEKLMDFLINIRAKWYGEKSPVKPANEA
jgi:hypothetical protein